MHCCANQAADDHVHKDLLVEGLRCLAMPGSCTQSTLKITIESLNIPAPVIEYGQFCCGKQNRVQKRGYQATAAKTVSVNENNPHIDFQFFVGVLYLAEVITLAQFAQYLGTEVFPGRNDEIDGAGHDL